MDCFFFWIDRFNSFLGMAVPIILFVWFLYTRRQRLSKSYYDEITGIYAGFTKPTWVHKEGKHMYCGIIMNIKTINSQGYFKGDFDYVERTEEQVVKRSKNSFYGKLKYGFNYKMNIHPLDPNKNRIYDGKIYIVDRHDMPLRIKTIKPYLKCEFSIKHYREMGAIEFMVPKMLKDSNFSYPSSFVLYKSMGYEFEPYESVKEVVFKPEK